MCSKNKTGQTRREKRRKVISLSLSLSLSLSRRLLKQTGQRTRLQNKKKQQGEREEEEEEELLNVLCRGYTLHYQHIHIHTHITSSSQQPRKSTTYPPPPIPEDPTYIPCSLAYSRLTRSDSNRCCNFSCNLKNPESSALPLATDGQMIR